MIVNHENRITREAYKGNRIFRAGWIHLGIHVEEFVPDIFRVRGMQVAKRTMNLLYKLQHEDPTVESLLGATGFFGPRGLNKSGRDFASTLLPYFIYATNSISEYINDQNVWDGFMSHMVEHMVGEPWTNV